MNLQLERGHTGKTLKVSLNKLSFRKANQPESKKGISGETSGVSPRWAAPGSNLQCRTERHLCTQSAVSMGTFSHQGWEAAQGEQAANRSREMHGKQVFGKLPKKLLEGHAQGHIPDSAAVGAGGMLREWAGGGSQSWGLFVNNISCSHCCRQNSRRTAGLTPQGISNVYIQLISPQKTVNWKHCSIITPKVTRR